MKLEKMLALPHQGKVIPSGSNRIGCGDCGTILLPPGDWVIHPGICNTWITTEGSSSGTECPISCTDTPLPVKYLSKVQAGNLDEDTSDSIACKEMKNNFCVGKAKLDILHDFRFGSVTSSGEKARP